MFVARRETTALNIHPSPELVTEDPPFIKFLDFEISVFVYVYCSFTNKNSKYCI